MLKVNRKKHDEFENEYAEMALKVMESKRLEGYDDIADEDWPSFVLREFYEKIVEYGLADEMGLEKLSDQVVERSLDDIRYFIKKLLLATPEQIHRAHIYLKSMKKNLYLGLALAAGISGYFQRHFFAKLSKDLLSGDVRT